MSTVVSFAYKGKLISFLTLEPTPIYARSLELLVDTGQTIGTFEAIWVDHTTGLISAASAAMDEILKFSRQRKVVVPKYLGKLNQSLKPFEWGLEKLQVMVSQLYGMERMLKLQNQTFETNEELSEDFAVLDLVQVLKTVKQTFASTISTKWVSAIVSEDKFETVMPFVVDRNFFYPLFKRGLAQIYEGGLYDRWNNFHQKTKAMKHLKETKELINKTYGDTSLQGGQKLNSDPEIKALAFSSLLIVWLLYAVANVLIFSLFVAEGVYLFINARVRKNKLHLRRHSLTLNVFKGNLTKVRIVQVNTLGKI